MRRSPKSEKTILIVIVFFSTLRLGAVEFFIEPKAGLVFGMVREIVYPVGLDTDNSYLSELRWDIKPAFMIGMSTGFTTAKDLVFKVNFQGALPAKSGEMYDYDWLYLNLSDWSHRSISDIELESAFIIDADIKGKLVRGNRWSLTISGGYHLDWWSWIDHTKEYLYSTSSGFAPEDWETGDPFRDFSATGDGSTGITYSVAYHVLYAGIGTVFSGETLNFTAGFQIGPVLALDHDHHLNTSTHYFDTGIGGPWMSVQTRFGIRTGVLGEFFINLNLSGFPEFKGRTDQYTESGYYIGSTSGGAGFQFWRAGFDIGYSFLL